MENNEIVFCSYYCFFFCLFQASEIVTSDDVNYVYVSLVSYKVVFSED